MLVIGMLFLLLTILFGAIVLTAILKNKKTPKPIVLLHGCAALFSILVLASYIAAGHFDYLLITSVVLFILAALGGLSLLIIDVLHKSISKVIIIVHPLIALSGFIVLFIYFLHWLSGNRV